MTTDHDFEILAVCTSCGTSGPIRNQTCWACGGRVYDEPPRDTPAVCMECGTDTMTWANDDMPCCGPCTQRIVAETMAELAAMSREMGVA